MGKAKRALGGKFEITSDLGFPAIKDMESGQTLSLKGYGGLKGEYSVKKGINLSKPILAQTLRKASRAKSVATCSLALKSGHPRVRRRGRNERQGSPRA